MFSFRSRALLAAGAAALALPSVASALPTPSHTPAPRCETGVVPVRGVVVDDGHKGGKGLGHTVHGQGFGYGHSCGGGVDGTPSDGGNDGGIGVS